MKQRVTIVTKPEMVKKRQVGNMFSLMEGSFDLVSSLPPKSFTYPEIRDMYDLIGVHFNRQERTSWGFDGNERDSGAVFMFTFEAEHGHEMITELAPHKTYPVIYIKV